MSADHRPTLLQPRGAAGAIVHGAERKPHRVGNYEMGRTIGEGTFAKVKRCFDLTSGNAYAVKVIPKNALDLDQLEEAMLQEIAVAKKLRHPNIVALKEAMQSSTKIYVVMDLEVGGRLFDRLQQSGGRFPEDVARSYFQQLLLGLRYCHWNGMPHRDLKPENLLLDGRGHLKISDVGLSTIGKARCEVLEVPSLSLACTAPEVFLDFARGNSAGNYNAFSADLWSCGVILFAMLTGAFPFSESTVEDLSEKIQLGEYRIPRFLSESAKDLIARLLIVEPDERYTVENIVAHPWFQQSFDRRCLQLGERIGTGGLGGGGSGAGGSTVFSGVIDAVEAPGSVEGGVFAPLVALSRAGS